MTTKKRKPKEIKREVGKQTKITSMFKQTEKNNTISTTSKTTTRAKNNNCESEEILSNCSPARDLIAQMISPSTDVEHSRSLFENTAPDLDSKLKSENNLVLPEDNLSLISDPND